ncbi:MAG TPA: phosphoribosylglycinamide formyltransferase [Flavobacteriales bacterium]|nr:phosphoribosylglycinamide formyltransferase [Flavobacteriales bacterium]
MPKKLAIFASGSGSNAQNICNYFANHSDVKVVLICTNNLDAFIVKRAKKLNIPITFITKTELNYFINLYKKLQNAEVDFIILAGFLLRLPTIMVEKYPNHIINIHPSLLPKYGGRGMYGDIVHKAVLKNKEIESGISIHFVNQNYDEGELILQEKCSVSANETLETLAAKIHQLERKHLPLTIEKILKNHNL